ncbi:hypothetical protein BDM02DRAFT_3186859 [Thelephora ganbajun]|uniref:Uncharacterized protein n=1 Tax=Thelephora ganbajun TaxID=370292 RepID=A0ACB6ZHX7_THEGA|nr:hypothetical protein BDM02DRAFT_3186859 [Thelephora ganbajun]
MLHPVFQIDELLRLVVDELVETRQQAAISFALTCRSLEEPTLSSLWKHQDSLTDLLKVLPNHTWVHEDGVEAIGIEQDPSAEDWTRLRRYASWMRRIDLGPDRKISRRTFFVLSRNCPGGVLFPKLEWLLWDINEACIILTFFRLFFSPSLKRVTSYGHSTVSVIPQDMLEDLAQIILSFPASLEDLSFTCVQGYGGFLSDEMSSFVCRRGSSLRQFSSNVPLSEAAICHLMQLPSLRSWTIVQKPPQTIPTSIFPPLEQLHFDKPVALPWLHLLTLHRRGVLRNGSASATSHTNIRETLTSITYPCSTIDNSTLPSSVLNFRNLTVLCVETHCSDAEGCNFHLTDNDTENLVTALPRLEKLQLGQGCRSNSCNTTVASLLMASVYCLSLRALDIHFNTRTIVGDIQRLLGGGFGRDKVKCKLWKLTVGYLPLRVYGEDIETVATGFKFIFPHLRDFGDYSGFWYKLRCKIRD